MTNQKQITGPLPGMAAVALWMFLLCGIGIYGVIAHQLPWAVLILCDFEGNTATIKGPGGAYTQPGELIRNGCTGQPDGDFTQVP